jgi:hypothetical protein
MFEEFEACLLFTCAKQAGKQEFEMFDFFEEFEY